MILGENTILFGILPFKAQNDYVLKIWGDASISFTLLQYIILRIKQKHGTLWRCKCLHVECQC